LRRYVTITLRGVVLRRYRRRCVFEAKYATHLDAVEFAAPKVDNRIGAE
jgi:hypothetical protein